MFTSLLQKASSYISDSPAQSQSANRPNKAVLFRSHFRLPDSQSPLQEITCELTLPSGDHYSGKLYLSEAFLCYTPSPPSASAPAPAPAGIGFTLPLCAIRRVERLHSRSYMFALAITTWHGTGAVGIAGKEERLTLQFVGMRSSCEAFCDRLKRALRSQMSEVKNLKILVESCYSEYLLSTSEKVPALSKDGSRIERSPPDAGLGMMFKYPGDARKLRDRSKMRLWAEYLRGTHIPRGPNLVVFCLLACWEKLMDFGGFRREWKERDTNTAAHLPQARPSWTSKRTFHCRRWSVEC